jgi:hypothetical protein
MAGGRFFLPEEAVRVGKSVTLAARMDGFYLYKV